MKISQREAKRLQKRVDELEAILRKQRNAFVTDWPSSIVVARITPDPVTMAQIQTARKLDHAVVAVPERSEIRFLHGRCRTKGVRLHFEQRILKHSLQLEPMRQVLNDTLTTKEAARFLRIHPVTLRRKAELGEIPGRKIGRVWRFSRSVLELWMSNGIEFEPAPRSQGKSQ
jgi:excisionase family DNA binding protein